MAPRSNNTKTGTRVHNSYWHGWCSTEYQQDVSVEEHRTTESLVQTAAADRKIYIWDVVYTNSTGMDSTENYHTCLRRNTNITIVAGIQKTAAVDYVRVLGGTLYRKPQYGNSTGIASHLLC